MLKLYSNNPGDLKTNIPYLFGVNNRITIPIMYIFVRNKKNLGKGFKCFAHK